ncbi:MAG: cofactor-independent phosphoglycerate mutase, partial [Chitinispirillaceae bacterium]|nr:cofactor-independent phosphoglycerate mutase [Chitinispirillaceae bacterium]
VATIPEGLPAGSDVANMSLMGYDPTKYYSGRAPIEAASMGIKLSQKETAFRCNLVTIENQVMVDYSAGHISTEEARSIIDELKKECSSEKISFYAGVSYRHLVAISDSFEDLVTTPPHDITGQKIDDHLPKGEKREIVLELMKKAHNVLLSSSVNKKRKENGKKIVTDIWLWGQGKSITLPLVSQKYGLRGTVISAVDLVKGLGLLAGLNAPTIPGATGYLGTNYAGKIEAAYKALEEQELVYLHVEAPDETGHEGILEKKIQAIEEFDRNIVGEMIKIQNQRGDLRILVTPDHPTPLAIKTHSREPVPFTLCGPGIRASGFEYYNEKVASDSKIISGPELFDKFIKQNW